MMRRYFTALAMALCLATGSALAEPAAQPAAASASAVSVIPAEAGTQVRSQATPSNPVQIAPAAAPVVPGAGTVFQTIFALGLVLGLLWLAAWSLKRFGPRPAQGGANMRIVGGLNLGGRERIMVVEIGDQWIIVGAAPGRVNTLHTMPKQEGVAPAPHAPNFGDWLKQTIDKRNGKE